MTAKYAEQILNHKNIAKKAVSAVKAENIVLLLGGRSA